MWKTTVMKKEELWKSTKGVAEQLESARVMVADSQKEGKHNIGPANSSQAWGKKADSPSRWSRGSGEKASRPIFRNGPQPSDVSSPGHQLSDGTAHSDLGPPH